MRPYDLMPLGAVVTALSAMVALSSTNDESLRLGPIRVGLSRFFSTITFVGMALMVAGPLWATIRLFY
ncbi:MAG: hypothetical protein BWY24_00645 [Microgenomates group bacterium ADurb.Bin219]|nr:MAG: hypothetical protein BWY24_00645 [Microgenomates group bacterium ADurb.Bin219]